MISQKWPAARCLGVGTCPDCGGRMYCALCSDLAAINTCPTDMHVMWTRTEPEPPLTRVTSLAETETNYQTNQVTIVVVIIIIIIVSLRCRQQIQTHIKTHKSGTISKMRYKK